MNLDDAIKVFESPRPNGWFRDDEVKAALEALREKKAREKPEQKRPSLKEIIDHCSKCSTISGEVCTTIETRALDAAAADIIRALDEKVVPWLREKAVINELAQWILPAKTARELLRALGEDA